MDATGKPATALSKSRCARRALSLSKGFFLRVADVEFVARLAGRGGARAVGALDEGERAPPVDEHDGRAARAVGGADDEEGREQSFQLDADARVRQFRV